MITSTAYLAPVQFYAHLYASDHVIEDRGEHYIKQTFRNRCYIATPIGPQALTLPIIRSKASHTPVRDIRLSDHGNWQHLHWAALESAYENSPFFEYYADDFRRFYEKQYKFLVDFNEELLLTLMELLQLQKNITVSNEYVSTPDNDELDLRSILVPKKTALTDPLFQPFPYYQVFSARTGFLPNLSILDLLFNMGPESRIVLRKSLIKN